ncbi:MAG: SdpI family protein [Tepidanaerobacteraceae bacterium]|jgi:uncharacterized membrane protein
MTKKASIFPIRWPVVVLIIGLYVVGFILYPYLPDNVPSHWNIHGQIDGYSSKTFHILFFPTLILGLYLLMSYAPFIDPKPESYSKFKGIFENFRLILVLILAGMYIATTLAGLGIPVSVGKIVRFAIGILLIFIGNYFGKIRHNYTFGIKTPWTLANEEVWNKTHRASGPLWVLSGLVWVLTVFMADKPAFIINMSVLVAVSVFGVLYSFVLFKRLQNR